MTAAQEYRAALTAIRARYADPGETPPAALPPIPTGRPLLKRGSTGARNRTWIDTAQGRLRDLGYYAGRVDHDFGPKTEDAVRRFQGDHLRRNGAPLGIDGKIGDQTWWALDNPRRRGAAVAGAAETIRSPWADVTDDQWARMVKCLVAAPVDHVSAKGALGMFLYDPRRLETLGLMTGVARDAAGRWAGEFTPPMTAARWLGSPRIQARTLARDMTRLRNRIEAQYADAIGRDFMGRRATLSGLLAVAHATGPDRLGKWIASDSDRERFPNTTILYLRATGIF